MSDMKLIQKITVSNLDETGYVAAILAPFLEIQDVVALNGTLGAGKTAFARALIRALCGANLDVPSPTFNLLLLYEGAQGPVYHYDFYRLEDPDEVWELDIEDAFYEGITIMEWSANIKKHLPDGILDISLNIPDTNNENMREIVLSGNAAWHARLQGITV